jgi:hypothetical protein
VISLTRIKENEYIWYASYGSNLSKERFLCYIQGGKPEGSKKYEVGARDQSLPIKESTYILHYPLYFAKESIRWQKQGVAFIGLKKDKQYLTYSRKYLITVEQFQDVVKQENNGVELTINFDEVKKKGYTTLRDSWYGTILYVGEKGGFPIFTFTADWDLDVPFTKPSNEYLTMIIQGLKKYVGLNQQEIVHYLFYKQGINGHYTKEEIKQLTI